jgi:hypothetical protein
VIVVVVAAAAAAACANCCSNMFSLQQVLLRKEHDCVYDIQFSRPFVISIDFRREELTTSVCRLEVAGAKPANS